MNVAPRKGEAPDRAQVWLAAWLAVASSHTCLSAEVAANWADNCLHDFDERFPAEPTPSAGREGGRRSRHLQEA